MVEQTISDFPSAQPPAEIPAVASHGHCWRHYRKQDSHWHDGGTVAPNPSDWCESHRSDPQAQQCWPDQVFWLDPASDSANRFIANLESIFNRCLDEM